MQAEELGAFLRSRRERLRPSDVGLPDAGRRRTPGLRREDVAVLAGIGVSWLTRLEQGRANRVSSAVLDRLADVLGLTPEERHHLDTLAADRPSPPAAIAPTVGPTPEQQAMLDALLPKPAYLLDHVWDLVAWNRAEVVLFPQLLDPVGTSPSGRPNLLRLMFGHQELRRVQRDWAAEVDRLTVEFRHHLTDHPSAEADALIAELSARHPEFAERWKRHDVASFKPKRRTFDHAAAGELTFHHHRFGLFDHPGWHLVVYIPDPSTPTADRLHDVIT